MGNITKTSPVQIAGLIYPSRVVSLTGQPLPKKIDQVSLTKPENPVRTRRVG